MVLEYLFFDKSKKTLVEEYEYSYEVKSKGEITRTISPTVSFTDFEGTEHWAVKYEIEGNTEEVAKHLANINDYVIYNFSPIILRNESSAYFNKNLFQ